MSDRFESRFDVWCKVDNEGGLYDAITSYGLKAGDMPEGDTKLIEAWQHLEGAFKAAQPFIDAVTKMLNDAYETVMESDAETE